MNKATQFWISSLVVILAFVVGTAVLSGPLMAANETLYSPAATNLVHPGDIVTFSPTNGGTNVVRTITASNWYNSDLNRSNISLQHITLHDDSNYFAFVGTVSSTNGNTFLLLSSGTDYNNLSVGDQLTGPGNQQYLVTGFTNTNSQFTLAVTDANGAVTTQSGATGFLGYHKSITLQDSQPHTQGGIGGNGVFGTATYSTGNNGGVFAGFYLLDGIQTSHIGNKVGTGGGPNYLSISTGIGRGGAFANQIEIDDGSTFGAIRIQSDNSVAFNGALTNLNVGLLPITTGIITPATTTYSNVVNGTNFFTLSTVNGTNNNTYFTLTNSEAGRVKAGDSIFLNGTTYLVTDTTNQSIGIFGKLSGNYTNAPASNYYASTIWTDTTPLRRMAIAANGAPVSYFSANDLRGGYWLADGNIYTHFTDRQGTPNFFSINVGSDRFPLGGPFGDQLSIQPGCIFNTLILLANNWLGTQNGLTNMNGTPVLLAGGATVQNANLNVANGNIVLGASTNIPSLTIIQSNIVDGQLYTNTTGRNIYVHCGVGLGVSTVGGLADEDLIVNGTPIDSVALTGISTSAQHLTNILSGIVSNGFTWSMTNHSSGGTVFLFNNGYAETH